MSTFVPMIPLAIVFIILLYCAASHFLGFFTSESVLLPLGFLALLSVPSAGIWSYFNGSTTLLGIYAAICAIFFVFASLLALRLDGSLGVVPVISILLSTFAVAYFKLDVELYKNLLLGCCFSSFAIGIVCALSILSFHHEP